MSTQISTTPSSTTESDLQNKNIENIIIGNDNDGPILSTANMRSGSIGCRTSPLPLPKPPVLRMSNNNNVINGGGAQTINNKSEQQQKIDDKTSIEVEELLSKVLIFEQQQQLLLQQQKSQQNLDLHQQHELVSVVVRESSDNKLIHNHNNGGVVGIDIPSNSNIGDVAYKFGTFDSSKKVKTSISTSELKMEMRATTMVYPPLPPVPFMVSSSLPPLPPLPPSASHSSSFLNNLTPPHTLSSSLSSISSSPQETVLINKILIENNNNNIIDNNLLLDNILLDNSEQQIKTLTSTSTTTTTTTTTNNELYNTPTEIDMTGSLSPILKAHEFKTQYLPHSTKCGLCGQFTWGMIGKQGLMCKDCGFPVHRNCIPRVSESCNGVKWNKNQNAINQDAIKNLERELINSQSSNNIVNSNSCTNLSHSHSTGSTPILNTSNSTNSISNILLNHSQSSPSSPNVDPLTNQPKKFKRNSIDQTNKEFQQLFKSLIPENESLINHYSCGYHGSLIKPGRMYLTEHYLCFISHLVFDKTKTKQKVIPYSSIKSIEKKSGIAPNGILIKTEDRDYQFCLFIHKDEAFEAIESLLLQQEQKLLTDSINQKNVNGFKQLLIQRKSRTSVKSSKRSKSIDNSNISGSPIGGSNSPSSSSSSPLIGVIKSGDNEMMQLLLEYYSSNRSDEVNHVDKEGYSPLHVAVFSDISDQMLMQMIRFPAIRVQVKNMDGNTPLHYFCQKYRSPECQKIAQILIDRGANVNDQNNIGETPLHKAIFNNSVRLLMVCVLLKNDADVNIVNTAGESALHYAVRLGRIDVLKTLITAGADPMLVSSKERKTPLMLAEESHVAEIVDLLRRLDIIVNTLKISKLGHFSMPLILEEMSQEGSLSRVDESMMTRIGCYDEHEKKQFLSLKNKRIPTTGTAMPAITAGASELLKELENMDVGNGRWVIPQHEVEYTEKIGSGVSGKVYKGLYKNREIAIKVLKSADEAHNREEFLKEFHVLASLQSQLDVIVSLYGVILEPRICLVMEYCSRGSLYQVLHSDRLTWDKFFSLTHQILHGISKLHRSTPQIVHRDVKSLNFLVTRDWRIKVADFGLSRFNTKSNQLTLNKTRGTSAYCAPEVFQGKEFSEKSDVYSLGVVFWELIFSLINGRYLHPYGEYKKMNEFQIMLCTSNQDLRPTIPHNTPDIVKQLISRCWDRDLAQRPTCVEAIQQLEDCQKIYKDNQKQWDDILAMTDETSNFLLSMDSND